MSALHDPRSFSGSCPLCGYEHDYSTRREMEADWKRWTQPLERAMDSLSVALTDRDKEILRGAVGAR